MATDHPLISRDPDVLAGKPAIRGTRLSVEFVIGLIADGWSEADIVANYSSIERKDILACLSCILSPVGSERGSPSAV